MITPRTAWPKHVDVEPARPPAPSGDDDVVVTFIGHATFLVQSARGNVLTDPMYSKRASPLQCIGPRRVRDPGVRFDDLPEISVVLLSHNHYDHCDIGTLCRLARRFDPLVITPLRNGPLVRSTGIRNVEELDWWQPSSLAPFPVTLVESQHFSARTPFDRDRALWGAFVFELAGCRIYFAGDSGYGAHFASTHERLGTVDLALLPIGAYEPRWFMKDIHMNPAEAVQAHLDLRARRSIRCTSGRFNSPLKVSTSQCRSWCERFASGQFRRTRLAYWTLETQCSSRRTRHSNHGSRTTGNIDNVRMQDVPMGSFRSAFSAR